ncbi:MAG TPA: class I SAM-dependent methyltransferase [Acidobacteriota bacterium]|nr:class I SAM-dependent methyltransferase [Acidobacteriota bacterium]
MKKVYINEPDFSIDSLISKIQEGAKRHRGISTTGTTRVNTLKPLAFRPEFQRNSDDCYQVNELLQFHDRAFLQNAYQAILKRAPDVSGFTAFIEKLRAGRLYKIDILARLRYSSEGRAKKVRVRGLLIPAVLSQLGHLPVFGYLVRFAVGLVRLPSMIGSQQQFQAVVMAQQQQIADYADRISVDLLNHVKEESEALAQLTLQWQRVTRLLEETRQYSPGLQRDLDAFYVSFQDQFRGNREEIKKRLSVYLPLIRGTTIGSASMPILDVGCGRGEWLELLQQEGLEASGVEANRLLVRLCTERRFKVIEDDLMHYLGGLPDASLGAVTGFHVIEHLPFGTLIRLLDEAVRVLKPHGMVIFETPNPQNILVGSCSFYLDPTHYHPLPSPLMRFLIESKGLSGVQIINLNPMDATRLSGDSDVVKLFNDYLHGPMDYAVLGWKP